MKKKLLILAGIVIVVLLCAVIGIAAMPEQNPLFHIGRLFQEKHTSMDAGSNIAAVYHGQEVSMETVESYRKARSGADMQEASSSDRDILNEILQNMILTEEAESRGLAATEEEVDAKIELQKQWYEEYDAVRDSVDSFCEGAGLQVEAYYEILREQLPRQIARAKLFQQLSEEWCAAHNTAYNASSPPKGMTEAVNRQLDDLVSERMKEATIYIH